MQKHALQMTEKRRRQWMKRFRQIAIFEWLLTIPIAGMGYMVPLMYWDSHLAALGGVVLAVGARLLASFGIPHWRRAHIETWRLLRQRLPLDTMK